MGCRGFRTSGLSRVPRIPEPGGHISGVVRMRNLTLLQGYNVGLRRSRKSRCQAIATLAICQDLQLLSRLAMPRKVPSMYLPHVRPRHRLDQDHPLSCPSPRQSLSFGWNLEMNAGNGGKDPHSVQTPSLLRTTAIVVRRALTPSTSRVRAGARTVFPATSVVKDRVFKHLGVRHSDDARARP